MAKETWQRPEGTYTVTRRQDVRTNWFDLKLDGIQAGAFRTRREMLDYLTPPTAAENEAAEDAAVEEAERRVGAYGYTEMDPLDAEDQGGDDEYDWRVPDDEYADDGGR